MTNHFTMRDGFKRHGFSKAVVVELRLFFGYHLLWAAARLLKVPYFTVMHQDKEDLILTLSSRNVTVKGLEVRKKGNVVHQSGILKRHDVPTAALSAWKGRPS